MVNTLPFAPWAIFLGLSASLAVVFFALSGSITGAAMKFGKRYQTQIDRADMQIKAEDFVLIVFGGGAFLWIGAVFLFHVSTLIGIAILPLCISFAVMFGSVFLKFKGDRRVNGFTQQLELTLRMMSGALRVGLGLRQAMILVTEEVSNPARREFMRVVGRTNIGISILDALDELHHSMPSHEMLMMARAIRIQSQTGGDLAKVLETLAGTIRDRRRVQRKKSALTAQGRGSAWIIGALPLVVGGFVLLTQPDLRDALLNTFPGHIALGIVVVLEGLAIFALVKILQFDV